MTPRAALLLAVLETGAVFGLLAWVQAVAVAAFRPDLLVQVLASWVPVRRDTAGVAGFAISFVCVVALDYRDGLPWSRARQERR